MTRCFILILVVYSAALTEEAQAGFLLSPGVSWRSFSFQPRDKEPTPNYYGYGFGLNLGWSIGQVVDVVGYGRYTPARLKKAEPLQENATLWGYGGELAFRLARTIYVAGRGGRYFYNLLHQKDENEVRGRWAGVGGGGSVGAQFNTSRTSGWQISVDYTRIFLKKEELGEQEEDIGRTMDAFSLSLCFLINGQGLGGLLGGDYIGDFLNSLGM